MKIIGKFFAVILSIVYFAFLISFVSLFYAQTLLTGDFYSDVLTSIDLTEIKLSDIDATFDGMEHYEDATVADLLLEGLVESGVDEEVANEIVSNENVKSLIGELIGEYIEYQINQENIPQIEIEDIEAILNDLNVEVPTSELEEATTNINIILEQLITYEGGDTNDNS